MQYSAAIHLAFLLHIIRLSQWPLTKPWYIILLLQIRQVLTGIVAILEIPVWYLHPQMTVNNLTLPSSQATARGKTMQSGISLHLMTYGILGEIQWQIWQDEKGQCNSELCRFIVVSCLWMRIIFKTRGWYYRCCFPSIVCCSLDQIPQLFSLRQFQSTGCLFYNNVPLGLGGISVNTQYHQHWLYFRGYSKSTHSQVQGGGCMDTKHNGRSDTFTVRVFKPQHKGSTDSTSYHTE